MAGETIYLIAHTFEHWNEIRPSLSIHRSLKAAQKHIEDNVELVTEWEKGMFNDQPCWTAKEAYKRIWKIVEVEMLD